MLKRHVATFSTIVVTLTDAVVVPATLESHLKLQIHWIHRFGMTDFK